MIELLVIVFIIGVLAAIAVPSLSGMLASAKVNQTVTELRVALQESQRQSIRNNQSCETRFLIPENSKSAASIQGSCLTTGDRTLPSAIGIATNVLPDPPTSTSGVPPKTPIGHRFPKVTKAGFLEPLMGWAIDSPNTSSQGQTIGDQPIRQLIADNKNDDDDDDDCENKNGKGKGKNKGHCKNSGTSSGTSGTSSDNITEPSNTYEDTKTESSGTTRGVKDIGIQFSQSGGANFKLAYDETTGTIPADHSAKFIAFRPNNVDQKMKCVVISRTLGLTRVGVYKGDLSPTGISQNGTCSASAWIQQ